MHANKFYVTIDKMMTRGKRSKTKRPSQPSVEESAPTTRTTETTLEDPRWNQIMATVSALTEEVRQLKTSMRERENSTISAEGGALVTAVNNFDTPSTSSNEISNQTCLTITEDRKVKLYDLPYFDGKPESWPLFFANYNDTTKEFRYNNRQNLMRLQKCLQGDAKKTVESLLIFPDDVPQAMQELKFNYGRPELLIHCQLDKIKELPQIPEHRLHDVLTLSNRVKNIVAVFTSTKCDHHLMNPMLLENLVGKLPPSKQFEWAKHASALQEIPTIKIFADWVSDLAKVVSAMALHTSMRENIRYQELRYRRPTGATTKRVLVSNETTTNKRYKRTCIQCNQEHDLYECVSFETLTTEERWTLAKNNRICFSCLRYGHNLQTCNFKKKCGEQGCQKFHHRLLHDSKREEITQGSAQVLNCRAQDQRHLFTIVPVILRGPAGTMSGFAMLDDGSSVSLLDKRVADILGLRGQNAALTLQWYNDAVTQEESKRVSIEISGQHAEAEIFTLKGVYTIKNLNLPKQSLNKNEFNYFKSLPIINYNEATPVILLGVDNCHLGISSQTVRNGPDEPVAVMTNLGWIVFGKLGDASKQTPRYLHIRRSPTLEAINKQMEEYFSIENFGVKTTEVTLESDEHKYARRILSDHTKDIGGRYETGLLWRNDGVNLPDSLDTAKRRLIGVENKMSKDPKYATMYKAEMQKYVDKGYAELVPDDEINKRENNTWYLPHFGVWNPNKPDKLRIVFDAASMSNGVSLNTVLSKGPEQAQKLIKVLFQFRQGQIAVAGDIQEMFSQIKIRKNDQEAQRYLWRDGDCQQPIRVYRMTSMTFGAACSPCCAEYVKNLNAKKHAATMPKGAKAIIENTYVDDLVASFGTYDEAKEACVEAVSINAAAGFNLRGFLSNSIELEQLLNNQKIDDRKIVKMDRADNTEKVLGLYWDKEADRLRFQFKFHKFSRAIIEGVQTPTKREMLGIIMSIYDPFGLIANFTIFSKLLLQATWKLQTNWDEILPQQLAKRWHSWCMEVRKLQQFEIPRCYFPSPLEAERIELHIFVDASQSAYAAVAYFRIIHKENAQLSFVAAKARCAPLRGMTIPRLELQAAVLGCRLKLSIEQNHDIKIRGTTFWCDSMNVISWIHSHTREYKQFVACRVAEILNTSDPEQWRWLPGEINVADDATRGQVTPKFDLSSRWLTGPEFLKQNEINWPHRPNTEVIINEQNDAEIIHRRVQLIGVGVNRMVDYTRFSSFDKMIRTFARIKRFIQNCRSHAKMLDEFTAAEIDNAEVAVCRLVQMEKFQTEIDILNQGKTISKSSELYQLTPYVDSAGLLRVNGRLNNAYCLEEYARRPIIMPKDHYVSKLIINHFHRKQHHQNDHVTINELRQRFWIPSIRAKLNKVKNSCPTCISARAKPVVPRMGQLPGDRVTPYMRPFSYSGVDYCGPFMVSIGRRREKRWVALFTCLNTRAVHIEVASDLSSDAFLLCLRNFINRRGVPVRMRSDNGTNFIGAQKVLKEDDNGFDFEHVKREFSKERIEWVFNCPAQPNAGGCWERLIQCVKRILHQVLKEEAPKLEVFRSVLIEAENIINSRPLTHLPVTPEEEDPLTPNHFLVGNLNSTQTPGPAEEHVCLRKNWKIAQNLKDRFWKRWVLEYLPQLLKREKWQDEADQLKVGQLVLILDHNQPRSKWQRGIISEVHPGKDGQVRVASVKTSVGILRRPASKLAALTI